MACGVEGERRDTLLDALVWAIAARMVRSGDCLCGCYATGTLHPCAEWLRESATRSER